MSLKNRCSKGRSSERMQNKDKMIPSWRIRVKGSTYDNNKLKTFLSKRHVESCHTLYWKTKVKGILFHLLFFVLVVIFYTLIFVCVKCKIFRKRKFTQTRITLSSVVLKHTCEHLYKSFNTTTQQRECKISIARTHTSKKCWAKLTWHDMTDNLNRQFLEMLQKYWWN